MVLVCYMTSQDHMMKWSYDFYRWKPLIVTKYPAKFGDHSLCCSGDIFLVVEELDSKCSKRLLQSFLQYTQMQ